MAAPLYNDVGSASSGAAGTSAFTPAAAVPGCRSWASVPAGWAGLVRYEDGSAWELCYSFWNGTQLTRATTQMFASSTGSPISLTSSATAFLVVDAKEVQPHIGGTAWGIAKPVPGASSLTGLGMPAITAIGTASAGAISGTNQLTGIPRIVQTSATTANAQGGIATAVGMAHCNTASAQGGFEFVARFGASSLPASSRLFCGLTSVSYAAATTEPSTLNAAAAFFGKDSTDTSIQLITNASGSGNGSKVSTGIALTANSLYEASIWAEPGSATIYGLLFDLTGGGIWYGSTLTDLPNSGTFMFPQIIGGLSATTGTAFAMNIGGFHVRMGS